MVESPLLTALPRIEHGFGTRSIDNWHGNAQCAWARQIHSDIVLVATQPGDLGEGDAIVTRVPGLYVSVRTADCIPILMADEEAGVVAAVHAGWRGTVARIGVKVLAAMEALGARRERVRVAIGPGIGVCCFDVGPEVSAEFGLEGKTCVDLPAVNRDQFLEAGLGEGQLWLSGRCTKCEAESFYSYRREREQAGRLYSALRVRV